MIFVVVVVVAKNRHEIGELVDGMGATFVWQDREQGRNTGFGTYQNEMDDSRYTSTSIYIHPRSLASPVSSRSFLVHCCSVKNELRQANKQTLLQIL